jgi:hypothetical protein
VGHYVTISLSEHQNSAVILSVSFFACYNTTHRAGWQAVTLSPRIRKVLILNPDRITVCLELVVLRFLSSPSKFGILPGHDRFLPNPFQFVIYISSFHWTIFSLTTINLSSRDSSVGIASGYGLHYRGVGVRVPVRSRIFSSQRRPDRLWGPLSLLSNVYRGFFPRG